MNDLHENQKQLATNWFRELRDRLCEAVLLCESQATGESYSQETISGSFEQTEWQRQIDEGEGDGGGGVMSIMYGKVFEKVGVNISTVEGEFSEKLRSQIPGADEDPNFWASGISMVAHPRSPLVPIAHLNTRMIVTTKHWFGGGGDLTPIFPVRKDTLQFHRAFELVCQRHDGGYYPEGYYKKFKEWCDDYFEITHRSEKRGVGGIFFDYLNTGDWYADFEFTKDVGRAFLKIYPEIVKRHMNKTWTVDDVKKQLEKRGRYVEFNLVYDRGTKFGLMTGGNIEAILMSLPPTAGWR